MKWSAVGKAIANFAPALGSVIGGPLGGGIGAMVAKAFGVENEPDAVMAAIKQDPDAAVKLQKIQSDERVSIERIQSEQTIEILQAVNETMRAESKSEHWAQWGWRPFWGFISGAAFFVVCCFVCYLAYEAISGKKPEAMAMIPQLIGSFTLLFGVPGAILGVASWHRGKQKRGV